MTTFPFRCTYYPTKRSRKSRIWVRYAESRKAAFESLVQAVKESTTDGVPGTVEALTCQEAHQMGIPAAVEC